MVAFGEIGLAGEVRPVLRGQERLREAAKLGFELAIIPRANAPKASGEGLEIFPVDRVEQAMARIR
jgi:DNA repair protein RadA/Sms